LYDIELCFESFDYPLLDIANEIFYNLFLNFYMTDVLLAKFYIRFLFFYPYYMSTST